MPSFLLYAFMVESSWNVMAHGDAREGKWRRNWRTKWVASTLHTTSEHAVSNITTADAHTSAASSRLNWRPPADLNGLVRFAERRNMVSARVPSHFKRSLRCLMQHRHNFICRTNSIPRELNNSYKEACLQQRHKAHTSEKGLPFVRRTFKHIRSACYRKPASQHWRNSNPVLLSRAIEFTL